MFPCNCAGAHIYCPSKPDAPWSTSFFDVCKEVDAHYVQLFHLTCDRRGYSPRSSISLSMALRNIIGSLTIFWALLARPITVATTENWL